LEFVLKVLASFPEVELYWLLNGKGTFPSTVTSNIVENAKEDSTEKTGFPDKDDKAIERIVIFYSDGSFKSFQN
jgi:hypothetical protein